MKQVTLTQQQENCVNFSEEKDLVVRGIAGSGKSLVLANRAVHLVRKGREMGKNPTVAFLTFAKTLVGFTNEFIGSCGADYQEAIKISNIDSVIFQMHKAMFRYKSFTYSDKILLPEEALQKYPEQSFAQKFSLCNRQKFSGRKIKEGF